MIDVTFADLVEIYRATRFDDENGDVLTIKNDHMVEVLTAIMESDTHYNDAQISVEDGYDLTVGAEVPVTISSITLAVAQRQGTVGSRRKFNGSSRATVIHCYMINLRAAGRQMIVRAAARQILIVVRSKRNQSRMQCCDHLRAETVP